MKITVPDKYTGDVMGVIENSERNHRLVYRINPEIVFRVDFF